MSAPIRVAALWSVLLLCGACAKGVYVPVENDAGPKPSNGLDASLGEEDAATNPGLDAQIMSKDASSMMEPDANITKDAGDSAVPMTCPPTAPCQSARMISNVKGDEDAQTSSAMGKGSEWLALTVTDTGNVFNADRTIKAKITLKSPLGSNYDLFVHRPSDAGGNSSAPRDCAVAPISSQNAVVDDVVSLSWGDETNSLGQTAGDGLILSIEVRHVSGSCDGQWTLTVAGNAI